MKDNKAIYLEYARKVWVWLLGHKPLIACVVVSGIALVVVPTLVVRLDTASSRYSMAAVPKRDVALVLGAGVLPSGEPTPFLKARIETAVDLYKAHKVKHLLVSGDNSTSHYNEPVVMKKYAVKLGVKASDVTVDYAGFNTYDSCYRALAIFGVTRMIVVTHGYHLPRAVATCNGLGIQTVGVAAKHSGRDFTLNYIAREMLSTNKALFQIVFKPQPTVLGGPDYIVIK